MISQDFRQFPVVTNQAQSIARSLFKRQYFALALLLLLFIPIAVLAAWGLHHSRPSYANYQFFSKDGKEYAVCNFIDVGKATMATLCIDAQPDSISRKSYSIKSIRFPESPMPSNKKSQTEKYLRVGEENGRTWVVKQFDSTTLVLFQIEFTSVLATTSVIELGEQVSGIRGVFICNGKLVLLINNRLEMRDAISGQVLDSLATQTSTKTDLIPMQGTRNVFTFDAVANKATMYEVGDDTFRPIQNGTPWTPKSLKRATKCLSQVYFRMVQRSKFEVPRKVPW